MIPIFKSYERSSHGLNSVLIDMIQHAIPSYFPVYPISKFLGYEGRRLLELMDFNLDAETWTISFQEKEFTVPGLHGNVPFGSYESPFAIYKMVLSISTSRPITQEEIRQFKEFTFKDRFFWKDDGKPDNPWSHIDVIVHEFEKIESL